MLYDILHNPEAAESRDFVATLKGRQDVCVMTWYGADLREVLRLVEMYQHPDFYPLPLVNFYKGDQIPKQWDRWERQCECHKDEPYLGPPPRAFPSVSAILPDGRLAIWDCPKSLDDCHPGNATYMIMPDDCIGGQNLDGALQTAASPWYTNNVVQRSVTKFMETVAISLIDKQIKRAINCIRVRTANKERVAVLQSLLALKEESTKQLMLTTCINEFEELEILRDFNIIQIPAEKVLLEVGVRCLEDRI